MIRPFFPKTIFSEDIHVSFGKRAVQVMHYFPKWRIFGKTADQSPKIALEAKSHWKQNRARSEIALEAKSRYIRNNN